MSNNDKEMVGAPIETEKDTANTGIQQSGGQMKEREFRNRMFKHFEKGDFCDITLKAGKKTCVSQLKWTKRCTVIFHIKLCLLLFILSRYPVHRVVLSAASDYFLAMFTNEMKEKHQTEIVLKEIDGTALGNLIEYCYKGEIELNEDNVDGLLAAAHMFRFTELEQQCTEYYKNALNSTNSLGIWAVAKKYNFKTVISLASDFAFVNFVDVVKCEEFKYMKVELLSELLRNDNVNVDSEEDVFCALVVWVEFELTERLSHMQSLIQTIRVDQFNKTVCFLNELL